MTDLVAQLVGALEWTIRELDRNACTHEETHRGGAIWTICDGCGMKWADDRGGFKPYKEPAQLKAARAALSAAKDGGWQDISTAPEGTMILCANMNAREARDWCFVAWMADGKVCGHRMDKPTHWQPLPNPPKGEV